MTELNNALTQFVQREGAVDRSASSGDALAAGLRLENVARLMAGREVARAVYVPGKILSIVSRPVQ